MTTQEVFDKCRIEGNNVYLPEQLDRPTYQSVNKALTGIGGKWNRKAKAHIFPSDPTTLLGRVQAGEKINLKKDYQFFETPPDLADRLVELAFEIPYQIGAFLEPEGGQGAIIDAIHRKDPDIAPFVCELMETNKDVLREKYGNRIRLLKDGDFLNLIQPEYFATIIANPPFTKNQDIEHVYHMYKCLEPGGRMVSIISNHYYLSTNRKEVAFREFLADKNAVIHNIPMGSFKASGTLVGGKIVVINKVLDKA